MRPPPLRCRPLTPTKRKKEERKFSKTKTSQLLFRLVIAEGREAGRIAIAITMSPILVSLLILYRQVVLGKGVDRFEKGPEYSNSATAFVVHMLRCVFVASAS